MTTANDTARPTCSTSPGALLARADLLLLVIDLLRSPASGVWPREPMPPDAALGELLGAAELGHTQELSALLAEAVSAAQRVDRDALSDEHHRLFDGAMPCPLNETAYVRRDKGAIIGDLAGFYRAFGFTPDPRSSEKPDHLLTELEFVVVLLIMSAQADNPEQRQVATAALAAFAAAHPADWLPVVCQRLAELTRLPLFHHTSAALQCLWTQLVAAHGWPVTPPTACAPVPEEDPGSAYECGAPGDETLVSLRAGGREI